MVQPAEFHVGDRARQRAWSAQSEEYSGGDALLSAVEQGWQVRGLIFCQEIWHGSARRARIYHITLERHQESKRMRVVVNPYVERWVKQQGVRVVQMNQRKSTALERW
ncbi:MAG: hypothetical protein HXY40_03380 [Chloroflexi bacterium]|nr:hypothetical protein [Chloroflexota bacterium]